MAEYTSGSVYGIVLLPNADDSQQCIDASSRLNELAPSLFTLNSTNARPHVSIVHVEGNIQTVNSVWNAVKEQASNTTVETLGLYVRPSEGTVWVGFDVRPTASLIALHTAAVDACKNHRLPIVSKLRIPYWPHITLGRLPSFPPRQLSIADMQFNFKGDAAPALAVLSKHGVVSEVIATLAFEQERPHGNEANRGMGR